jgi:ParB family chromosome partitioning protein
MFTEIKIDELILSKKNVRKVLETEEDETTIKNLAESIKANGLVNPLTVQKTVDGKYEILAGQRRFLALKELNIKTVTCKVVEDLTNEQAELISFVENVQRNKMSQQDKAYIFNKLFNMCHGNLKDVSKISGFSNGTIKDYVFIYENLTQDLFCKLDGKGESKLSMEIALLLAKNISKDKQVEIYDMILPLGTTEMKRQAILKFVQGDNDDELPENEEETHETKETEPKEKKVGIPKQPWVYDENGTPLIIPKELYPEICQLIKNSS